MPVTESASSLIGRTVWLLHQFRKKIWVRASLFSIAAVLVAILSAVIGPYIPYDPGLTLASGSVDHILNILASSMLAVTTFSLSIMVSAYSSATSHVTPRSAKLLIADPVAQNTLATFVGSFLFSIVGIIGLAAGLYNDRGRIILFGSTLIVIFLITATLLRWIEQLGKFGRVGDTIMRVERATIPAFQNAGLTPRLGAMPLGPMPSNVTAILSPASGMIQHIDVSKMNGLAKTHSTRIYLDVMPGALVHPARILFYAVGLLKDEAVSDLRECISIGHDREYEQDPRFGLIVLSEIASRALSPAVNDPGTAIEVLASGLRVLSSYADAVKGVEEPRFCFVHAPNMDTAELFASFFNPIARDGANFLEVQMRLIKILETLALQFPEIFRNAAEENAEQVAGRGSTCKMVAHEKAKITQRLQLMSDRLSRHNSERTQVG